MNKCFNFSLKHIVQPVLLEYGYIYDGKRKFIKSSDAGNKTIEFQLGLRSLLGNYTVNLCSSESKVRLGEIRTTVEPYS